MVDPLDLAAGRRPDDFHPVDFVRLADTQHFARIVRGKITPASVLQPRPDDATCRPSDAGPDRVARAPYTLEFESDPVILAARPVAQQNGRAAVDSDQNVEAPVVVEISHREAARGI